MNKLKMGPNSRPHSEPRPTSRAPPPLLSNRQENKPAPAAGGTWRWLSLRKDANQTPNYLTTNQEPHPITSSCP